MGRSINFHALSLLCCVSMVKFTTQFVSMAHGFRLCYEIGIYPKMLRNLCDQGIWDWPLNIYIYNGCQKNVLRTPIAQWLATHPIDLVAFGNQLFSRKFYFTVNDFFAQSLRKQYSTSVPCLPIFLKF